VKISTRKTTFFEGKIEARLPNHLSLGKAIKLHILSVRLQPYLFSMQSSCTLLYCHLWPVRIYRRFLHYLTNGTIVKKTLLNVQCVFWFSLQNCMKDFLF